MYWSCAKTEDAAATRMASPKIGSLLNLLMNFSIFWHFDIGENICQRYRSPHTTYGYMISSRSPVDFIPSFSVSKTWASNPNGWGSVAVASMPANRYMLPSRSAG